MTQTAGAGVVPASAAVEAPALGWRESAEIAPDGMDQDLEEDFLTACLASPEHVKAMGVKPSDLWVIRYQWLLEGMLEQKPTHIIPKPYAVKQKGGMVTPPREDNGVHTFDVEQLARSLARHGMDTVTAGALIAQLWSREQGDIETLARCVKALSFRRRAILAAGRLAKATTPTEALQAVEAVLR